MRVVVGLFAATFFLAELVLSPVFGILSDRLGHHRVMLFGPIFGGGRGDPDRAHHATCSCSAGRGSSRARRPRRACRRSSASSPSRRPATRSLRGKAAARFEGATLAGIGAGFIVAPKLFEAIGPPAFFLNAGIYGVSFLIYLLGVKDPAGEARGRRRAARRVDRYLELIRTSHVWLLAPTWIAINAAIGLWFSQSLFQFAKANPTFPDQALMARLHAPTRSSLAAIAVAIVFGAGLLYWGNRFKSLRRTTIIGYGVGGGGRARRGRASS